MKRAGTSPPPEGEGDVTLLLQRWQEGGADALADLVRIAYGQLHSIASGYMHREREEAHDATQRLSQ